MRLVYGVGINDLKGTAYDISIYQIWKDMLTRCYSESYQKKRPSYKGCVVSDDWLRFSNFHSWVLSQEWKGKQLDKDLLVIGNKIYSQHTCIFVSQELNSFLTERSSLRGKYPIGVYWDKDRKRFKSSCSINGTKIHLGWFDDPDSAHKAWLTKKLEIAHKMASQETDEIIAKAIIERYENYRESF